jgi:hypothetical protein
MKAYLYCCLLIITLASMAAQDQTSSRSPTANEETIRRLEITETITAKSQPRTALQLPPRCDDDGNIYFQIFHGTGIHPAKEPLHKLDKSGDDKATFSLPSDPEYHMYGTGTLDFAIDKQGQVYFLTVAMVDKKVANVILRFAKDGALKSKIGLDRDFKVNRFDVFDSGEFLVTGTERETKTNPNPHGVYTAVFDAQGKLLKKVVLPEDQSYKEAADRGDNEFVEPGDQGGGNFAVERGMVTRAADGNLYLMRWTTPARIYAISPAGEVVRSFEVASDWERKKPACIHAHDSRLAIRFEGDESDIRAQIKVVGLDGQVYATYDATGLGVAFACYTEPERFTFLGGQDKLQFIVATPQ